MKMQNLAAAFSTPGSKAEVLGNDWIRIQVPGKRAGFALSALQLDSRVEFVQPNYKIKLRESYRIQNPQRREAFVRAFALPGLKVCLILTILQFRMKCLKTLD